MKSSRLATGLLFVFLALPSFGFNLDSTNERDTILHYQQIRACDWWVNVQTNSGSAYACSSYPFSMNIVDARDVERALNNAERRIAALEAKIGTLEARLSQSE